MQEKRSLTHSGMSLAHMGFIVLNLIGLATTIYLTKHYFSVHFPDGGLGTGSAGCQINSFLNCDAATFSSISNIAGIPLSVFGLAVQAIFLLGSLVPSAGFEKTIKSLSLLNAIGCLILFIFSLFVLKSLCPFCTLYYITSWLGLYLLFKKSDYGFFDIAPIHLGVSALILAIFAGIGYSQVSGKILTQASETDQVIAGFLQLPDRGQATYLSPYTITKAPGTAKVVIKKFSDFQCPFCKITSDLLEKLAHKYEGKIDIHYYFYPLDSNCNSSMKRQMHPFACAAAKVAACDETKFKEVHDEIFANQANIDTKFLEEIKAKYDLKDCDNKKINDQLLSSMDQARTYGVQSTPTIIVNNRRIDSPLALVQWYALIDELLAR